ncbi:TIGR04222 domain-containing membrane protein [Streptomyces sp. MNU103]|uniref:TIGR04222 domain-containing membrane protein n=1 Tax=Streptomyces sp. MNU103 TaxID=2560024 RepID=UPI001E532956|nr:TIGR04222 domain-containing membrane protein [Streptomyces sp. MNU103]
MAETERARETPHELALLAGGPRAAVVVAVVALHLRGAVEPGARNTVVAVDNDAGRALPPLPTQDDDADVPAELRVPYLESAVYRRLHGPCHVRELLRDPDVRWAVATLRTGLAETGMVSPPALGATRAARRRLQVLRTTYPVPASRDGLSDEEKLLAVALHGQAALRVAVPRFALRTGLTPRPPPPQTLPAPLYPDLRRLRGYTGPTTAAASSAGAEAGAVAEAAGLRRRGRLSQDRTRCPGGCTG